MKRHNKFYVYIIQDKNDMYYTGFTRDVVKRSEAHEKGLGAKFLKGKKPLKVVFVKEYRYYKNALAAERRIKKYTRERKQELIGIFAQGSPNVCHTQIYRGGTHV